MNETRPGEPAQIEAVNFGPIVSAKIDLRPMTVFVGPSNTGKSYLAILIYALHRFFGGNARFSGLSGWGRIRTRSHRPEKSLSNESVNFLLQTARALANDWNPEDLSGVTLTPEIADALRRRLEGNADALAHEIGRCFGIGDLRALTRKGQASAAQVTVRRRMSDPSGLDDHVLTLGREANFKTAIPAGVPIAVNREMANRMQWLLQDYAPDLDEVSGDSAQHMPVIELMLSEMDDLVLPHALRELRVPAFYLPADRTGVMHAHSVVVSALIANASVAGLRPAGRTPMLPGVLADFLEQLIEIGFRSRARSMLDPDFGTRIEEKILGGAVRVNPSSPTDYPEFSYRPKGWKEDLALVNTSSMVSELASVILYLRHLVGPGNVLIVEEPEAHLHPSLQVEFTHQLAALASAGMRVIVTTHSEWLLEALANIVGRSERSGHRHHRATDGNVMLHADQVGVWLFEPKGRPRGSVVREIRLDESGLFPTGYGEVAEALHNEWAGISSEIGNGP